MLKRNYLWGFTDYHAINNGEELYYSGNVGTIHSHQASTHVTTFHTSVIGIKRDFRYQPTFAYDQNEDKIIKYHCNCPAYHETDVPCEHLVAAILKLINAPKDIQIDETSSTSVEIESHTRKTSQKLKHMLQSFHISRMDFLQPVEYSQYFETIVLIPLLSFKAYRKEFDVEFKIKGPDTREYTIKSINAFLDLIKQKEVFSYGKQLEFRHTIDSFTLQSQKIINFLENYRELNKTLNRSYSYNSIIPSSSLERTMPLRQQFLDDFLEIFSNQRITIAFDYDIYNCDILLDDKPNIEMKIKKELTGYSISHDRYSVVRTANYLYIFFHFEHQYCKIHRISLNQQNELNIIENFAGSNEETYLAEEDVKAFVQQILPVLKNTFIVTEEDTAFQEYIPSQPSYTLYIDVEEKETITARLEVSYGAENFDIFSDTTDVIRDVKNEMDIIHLVRSYFPKVSLEHKDFRIVQDNHLLFHLLKEGIAALNQKVTVYASDHFHHINLKRKPQINLGVSINHDLLQLSISSNELSNDEIVEILSKYNPKVRYCRLKNGDFIELDEEIDTLKNIQTNLQLTRKDLQDGIVGLPTYRALYLDALQSNEKHALSFDYDTNFKEIVYRMKNIQNHEHEIPVSIQAELRPYQKRGYWWLRNLMDNHLCGLLADEMGLGKTLQVITFLASLKTRGKTLIIAPASLIYNWANELAHFAPHLPVVTITGSASIRNELMKEIDDEAIMITSYHLLQKDIEIYQDFHFTTQIIDEAQYIKNANTLNAKAVKAIHSSFRIALTGTPIENRLSELWSIFDYLMPGFLFSYERFRRHFELPIASADAEEDFEKKELQSMISPFILRRLKKDVLKDLPDKIEEEISALLEEEQQLVYNARVQAIKQQISQQSNEEFKNHKIEILSELTHLRMLCCSPKLLYKNYEGNSAKEELCIELIRNAVESGHKVLLFSQFTSMLEILCKRLEKENISHFLLTGSTPKEKRAELVNAFQTDCTNVFCISLKAGGTGLNLTAADIVIHYDPWWNTAVETQASDRAHRIGQTNTVTVYRLILKNTLEEKILELQKSKKELSDKILSGEAFSSITISREELLSIL